jgi:hypothetical protein
MNFRDERRILSHGKVSRPPVPSKSLRHLLGERLAMPAGASRRRTISGARHLTCPGSARLEAFHGHHGAGQDSRSNLWQPIRPLWLEKRLKSDTDDPQ